MAFLSSSQNNRLLAALPTSAQQRWLPQLQWVYMPLGQVLHEPDHVLGHVHFPVTSVVALIYVTASGSTSGVASIGSDSLVGVEAFMDGRSMPCRAVVQSAGYGYRLPALLVKQQFEACSQTMHLLLLHTEALLVQIAQLAVCSCHHGLDQRLGHWLLRQLDHVHSGEILATHELISKLMGVRRESVTEGLKKLQNLGAIHYSRGHISVSNRDMLEKHSCECHRVIQLACDKLTQGHSTAGATGHPAPAALPAAA